MIQLSLNEPTYTASKKRGIKAISSASQLDVATRADALCDDVVDYLYDISKITYLVVELGLQSVFDKTGEIINRCHTYEEFLKGYKRLSDKGINTCIHLIMGLPGEDASMMLKSVEEVAKLSPHAIKLHLLHVLKGTKLAKMYENKEFKTLSREEYVDIIVDALEIIPPKIIIQRLTGDGKKEDLIAPLWSLKKFCVLNEIDKEMVRRNCVQGCKAKY